MDQGVHNYVVRTHLTEEVEFFANETGPILTLNHVDPQQVRFDAEEQFLNAEGAVVNVVHQYDRHPELMQRVLERFGG